MASSPRRGIVTPEAVVLEFETASIGSRTLSVAIDVIVQLAIVMFGVYAVGSILALLFAGSEYGITAGIALFAVIVFVALFGYPVFMETRFSATLGKFALGLRVVTREGAPIRFRHAAIRAMLQLVDLWLVPVGVIGTLAMLFSRQSQRLGDLAAGTVVLRQPSGALRSIPVAFFPPLGLEQYVATLDANAVTSEQYGLIRLFLMRVLQLSPDARASLAARLATAIADRTHQPRPPWLHPETYLVCVATAYQRRHGGHVTPWGPAGSAAPSVPWGPWGLWGQPSGAPAAPPAPAGYTAPRTS
ncbi:MAG: RDD family protein [Acidimicrobiales bacterium]